jgi:hypothetical protein
MGEREDRDANASARSLSVVHYMERDQEAAAGVVAGLIDRSAASAKNPSFLAVLPSPDDVLTFCAAVVTQRGQESRTLVPLTSVARARRALAGGATSIAGAPADLARLIAESRLVLSELQSLVLVWPEETLTDQEQRAFLETILAEVPRTSERVAVCAQRSPDLAPFLERSMWRARTVDHVTPTSASSTPLRFITASPSEQTRALRSVLDALDPATAVLITFSDESESAASEAAAVFGSGDALKVARGVPEGSFNLGIVFDDVPDAESLTATSAVAGELVAIVRPSRVAALRKVAPNSTPMTFTGAIANARSNHDLLRDEIRGYVGSDAHVPWIPIVEPLLEGMDSVEVAAAALALLDRERRKAKRVTTAPVAAAAPPERRPREERPSRFGSARDDDRGGRPDRGFKKRPFGEQREARGRGDDRRGPPRRDRDDRPPRESRDRPPRDFRDRPPRDDRGVGRGGRRQEEIERVPRAAREGREWSERGERLKHSRRGPRDRDT